MTYKVEDYYVHFNEVFLIYPIVEPK